MRFYIETYGCTSNLGNSRDTEAALLEMGHSLAPPIDADLVIVNTCAVTEKTERKIKKRLLQLQGSRLVIAGCLPRALPGSVERISCRKRIGLLGRSAAREIACLFEEHHFNFDQRIPAPERPALDLCGIINIAEGCIGSCSYCIVKKARGRLVSRRPEEVVQAVQNLLKSGVVEVQLAAQDTAAYGSDMGTSLPDLLARVTEIPGRYMVRVGMMNPNTVRPILSELIDAFRNPSVYRFLHMPVQSGSDRILEKMRRGYRAEDYIKIVGLFKENLPDMSIATDVIAGFPGEQDEDFAQTLQLISKTMPDKVNITKFSGRSGTSAAELYDMPDRVKKERSRRLTRLWLEIACKNNQRYLGRIMDALVTERGRGNSMKARTQNYTGVVIQGLPALGSLQRVRITGSNPFYINGVMTHSRP